jgi:predicted TIM-barrel fold metal-dependent hydrolase
MTLDLASLPFVDHHAHNLLQPEHVGPLTFSQAFTEGYDAAIVREQVQETVALRRGVREVAELLGCEPRLERVIEARAVLPPEELARRCFDASGISALLLDDGFLPDRILPVDWHRRFVPSHRLLRVERVAEELMATTSRWEDFAEAFRAALHDLPPNVVALKSIVAYRTGLMVEPPDPADAHLAFDELLARAADGAPIRLAAKPLNDWVVRVALEAAARSGMPVQFHTGFGDPDLDLRLANPLHLRPVLEDSSFRDAPVVLLHAAYPFAREAGFLASVYPQVYVDFGLAVPLLSRAGMRFAVAGLLELSPLSKVMASTDAHLIPELFYLGARWARKVLADVLEGAVQDGDLTAQEAQQAAAAILKTNAQRLYGLPH